MKLPMTSQKYGTMLNEANGALHLWKFDEMVISLQWMVADTMRAYQDLALPLLRLFQHPGSHPEGELARKRAIKCVKKLFPLEYEQFVIERRAPARGE